MAKALAAQAATIDIALILDRGNYLYQGSVSQNTQAEYDAITWLDPRTKPTWAQVIAQTNQDYVQTQINATRKQVLQNQIAFYGTVEVIKILINNGTIVPATDLSQKLRDAYSEWNSL